MKRFLQGQGFAIGLLVSCALKLHAGSFTFSTIAGIPGSLGSEDGTNNTARLESPTSVVLGNAGIVYISDGNAVRQVTPANAGVWVISTLAGDAASHGYMDGTNSVAAFDSPQGLARDAAGNLYVADTLNNAIRKVKPIGTNWVVTTLVGNGRNFPGTADGTNTAARFDHPYGVAIDAAGNLYVADTFNQTIRKVTPQGTNWIVTTIAGQAGSSGSADGSNSVARFNGPDAITFNPSNSNLYVADFGNNTLRGLAPVGTNWVVTTLAGLAGFAGGVDGTNSNARFDGPASVTVDTSGTLFVADGVGNTIRSCSRSGTNWVVSTVAGLEGTSGFADGSANDARFQQPSGIAVNTAGKVFVADTANYAVRLGQAGVLLRAVLSPGQIGLSWPTGAVGYVLESATSAAKAPWHAITTGVAISGQNYTYSTNRSAPGSVFRLHLP